MGVIKSLWASVQGDPLFMRRVNGWLTIFWIVMIPASILTGWISCVAYVAALPSGPSSRVIGPPGRRRAWVEQAKEAEKRKEEDLPGEIVERIVEETEVEAEVQTETSAPASS